MSRTFCLRHRYANRELTEYIFLVIKKKPHRARLYKVSLEKLKFYRADYSSLLTPIISPSRGRMTRLFSSNSNEPSNEKMYSVCPSPIVS